jgi:hypothetical protein
MVQSNQENFLMPFFLTSICLTWMALVFLMNFQFHEDIVTRTSIYMLTSSNDPNEIERALKYPVVKKILRQAIVQRYSQSTIKRELSVL